MEFSSAVSGSVPQRNPVSPGGLATALCRKASAWRALPVGRCWVVHPPSELRVGLQAGARGRPAPGKGLRSHAGQQLPNGIGPQRDAEQNPFTGAERTPANPVRLRSSQLRLHISQRKPGKKLRISKVEVSFAQRFVLPEAAMTNVLETRARGSAGWEGRSGCLLLSGLHSSCLQVSCLSFHPLFLSKRLTTVLCATSDFLIFLPNEVVIKVEKD